MAICLQMQCVHIGTSSFFHVDKINIYKIFIPHFSVSGDKKVSCSWSRRQLSRLSRGVVASSQRAASESTFKHGLSFLIEKFLRKNVQGHSKKSRQRHSEGNNSKDDDNIADCRLNSEKLTAISHSEAPRAVDLLRRPSSSLWMEPLPLEIASADLSAMEVSHRRSRPKALLLAHDYCEGSRACSGICSVGQAGRRARVRRCSREHFSDLLLCTAVVN